jgi:RND family efflux transporter MFP subunit
MLRRLIPAACGALFATTASAANFDCIIEARQNIEIRSPVEAVIESVRVQRGDVVKKGQVLVTLESGPERAVLELARSRANMEGELKAAEARLNLAEKKLARAQELYAQNFISVNARDEAEAEYSFATQQLRQARENQRLAELEVKRAEEVLGLRTVRSPLNGVVVDVHQKPGEFATTDLRNPIVRLAEIDPLNVEVILPVSLYGKITVGSRAVVMPEAPIGGSHSAIVRVVDRVIDAASGTFGVRLELPNSNRQIPAGARCRVQF